MTKTAQNPNNFSYPAEDIIKTRYTDKKHAWMPAQGVVTPEGIPLRFRSGAFQAVFAHTYRTIARKCPQSDTQKKINTKVAKALNAAGWRPEDRNYFTGNMVARVLVARYELAKRTARTIKAEAQRAVAEGVSPEAAASLTTQAVPTWLAGITNSVLKGQAPRTLATAV